MIIDRKQKYKGYLNVDEITYKTKSGKEGKREVMVRKNAVAALLYDTVKEKYILISQWRPGSASDIVEVVAGTLDKPGEDPQDAMIREIEEEVGYATDSIKLIDECYTSPGGSSEVITSAKFLKRLVKVVVSQVSLKKLIPLKWIVKS